MVFGALSITSETGHEFFNYPPVACSAKSVITSVACSCGTSPPKAALLSVPTVVFEIRKQYSVTLVTMFSFGGRPQSSGHAYRLAVALSAEQSLQPMLSFCQTYERFEPSFERSVQSMDVD
jgi:hypothetical protein